MAAHVPPDQWPEWARWQAEITGGDHPVVLDSHGVLRYEANTATRWACDHSDLNELWMAFYRGEIALWDLVEFYRDIGYSLQGFDEIWGERLAADDAPASTNQD